MTSRKFYKTIVTIEVLSEEPCECQELEEVVYAITEGGHSGKVEWGPHKVLDGKEAADALTAQGSEPEFFGLTEDGEESDRDYGN